jgi:gluconolactonase
MYDTTRQETLEFWRSVAHRYRGVPTVAFYEIFNEPTTFNGTLGTASWEDWKAFNEEVIGVIFAHDRQVIPLVAGFDWAYDLTPVGEAPIAAEGIGYVSHPYPMKVVPPYEPKWERDFGFVAERYPLVITEFGFAGAGEPGAHVPVIAGDDYGPAILDYLEAKGASWVAWCFDPEWGPHLISDWDYTPTPAGRFFRDAMLGGRETVGAVERLDPALDRLVPPGAEIEVLAQGFDWSEGPLWIADGGYLLFSDVPRNQVLKWQQDLGVEVWLEPSGYTGTAPRGGEPGANGLVLDSEGRLVLSQHGDRRMARMEASLAAPRPVFTTLADRFDDWRFSSPNDAVYDSRGALYFTDPPYGLPEGPEDASRETPFHGVYRLDPDGSVSLVTGELSRPNGIALSPDEGTLYVANSDLERAVWMAYDLEPDGTVGAGRVLFDATAWVGERPGLPDGLEVDVDGNLFATGPGGVLVLTSEGRHLGTILTGRPTANCAFGDDGRSLYITADSHLLRIRLATRGPVVGGETAVASGR